MITVSFYVNFKFGSFASAVSAANNDWIWIRPDKFTLGGHSIGSKVPFALSIVNHTGKQIRLLGVELSCTCIRTMAVGSHFPIDIQSGTEFEVPFIIEVTNKGETKQVMEFVIEMDSEQRRLRAEVEAGGRK